MNADLYKVHELPKIPTELTDLVTKSDPEDSEWLMYKYTNRPELLERYRKILRWYNVPSEISDYIFDTEFFANHPERDKLGCFYHMVLPDCDGIHTDDLRTYTYNYVIDNGMPDNRAVPVATYDSDQNLVTQIKTYPGTWYYLNVEKNHRVWNYTQPRRIITINNLKTVEEIHRHHPELMI